MCLDKTSPLTPPTKSFPSTPGSTTAATVQPKVITTLATDPSTSGVKGNGQLFPSLITSKIKRGNGILKKL